MEYPSPALSSASPPYAFPPMSGPVRSSAAPPRSSRVSPRRSPSTPAHRSPQRPVPYNRSYDPMTPSSTPSPYTHNRAPSPALSCASARTSASAASHSQTTTVKPKQRKQRLDNTDRKRICKFHQDNPNSRQEDIAAEFGVERSTISKILKHKSKWLTAIDTPADRSAKHRPSKFPQIEEELRNWLSSCTAKNIAISDASIREHAKLIARALHISEDKFKASSGWVENFKARAGIQKGVVASGASITDVDLADMNKARLIQGSPVALEPMSPHNEDDNTLEDMDGEGDVEQDIDHITTTYASSHPHPSSLSIPVPAIGYPTSHSYSPTLSSIPSSVSSHHASVPPPSSTHQPPPPPPNPEPEYYQRTPQHIPTINEAETHIDALLLFVDAGAREGLITAQERNVLHAIKIALFEEAGGINPFGRG